MPCSFTIPGGRRVAPDTEVIAFGDLHGHLSLLERLLEVARGLPRTTARREVVFIGDLIDRGPDSVGTVGRSRTAGDELGADVVKRLAGNHEAMLEVALDQGLPLATRTQAAREHMRNGGVSTAVQAVAATGIERPEDALRAAFAPHLGDLVSHHVSGDVMFVHAGLHPGVPLSRILAMTARDLYGPGSVDYHEHWAWVRQPFLGFNPDARDGHHGHFVVHGHSIRGEEDGVDDEVAVARSRLNLDAGSYSTGRARMAVVVGDRVTVHETGARR